MLERRTWFLVGLFLTTLVTLCLEVLATRLLSVMTWYHLSFFAVSTAMFGMSAGALQVYLGGDRFRGEDAPRALARYGIAFAIVIPLCHLALLPMYVPTGFSTQAVVVLLITTLLLAIPFYFSGILVAIALTRIPGKIGLYYAVDLVGASLGSLLVLPLLQWGDIVSAHLFCAALAALSVCCYRAFAGMRVSRLAVLLTLLFSIGALWNPSASDRLTVWFTKGRPVSRDVIADEYWNIHAQLLVHKKRRGPYQYWGAGPKSPKNKVDKIRMVLDGSASTAMTAWNGDPATLNWVQHDVTSLPYHLRKKGAAAVIGVGGGRDLLTALWARSSSIRGVEINANLIDLLEGEFRDFANIADRPEVTLVHDEARSYFTRCEQRFDVLQMSLIDTWAATGAGAFTLTENGLYTTDAWRVFLDRLTPDGLFSVSRWYNPDDASETNRLLSLGIASMIERGVERPADHMVLVACGQVATLLVSPKPLSQKDIARVHKTSKNFDFTVLAAPDTTPEDSQMAAIFAAHDAQELARATVHPDYDYSPPTDERPFFFNFLKPGRAISAILATVTAPQDDGAGAKGNSSGYSVGIVSGNLVATMTLALLALITVVLVVVIILGPLAAHGLPAMATGSFSLAVLYFSSIGLGFMLVQVAFMQRFSVYLGHPTYSVVVILFSMILATGLGSYLSDRLPVERSRRVLIAFPLAIALLLFT